VFSQNDTTLLKSDCPSSLFSKKRLAFVVSSEAALYAGSIVGLNELWYKDYPRSSFHSFNDNEEWLLMDKVGHVTTSYYIGRVGIGFMKWTGMDRKKAIWYGGMLGFVYQSTIEVLDGFSSQWGFSVGDLAANTAGSLLCIGQELAWADQRIVLKYSFMQSEYSKYRPGLLGSNLTENLLKDYNGQTYWLSVNPASFMSQGTKFPKWLNVAVGYGADGMTGGNFNPPYIDEHGNQIRFERYSQFYLSLDVDLTRIKTRSKFLKTVFYSIGFIKIPSPALEFNKYGVKGSWLGF
jgi:VanZ family protein